MGGSNKALRNAQTNLLLLAPFLRPLWPSLFWAFSGNNLDGGLGGTLVLSRKMYFLFLISLPQRNLKQRDRIKI